MFLLHELPNPPAVGWEIKKAMSDTLMACSIDVVLLPKALESAGRGGQTKRP
jgi:hypothetical protein